MSTIALSLPQIWSGFWRFVRISYSDTFEKEAQNLSLCKGISSLAHFLLWLLRGADLFLSLDFELGYCYCVVAP